MEVIDMRSNKEKWDNFKFNVLRKAEQAYDNVKENTVKK